MIKLFRSVPQIYTAIEEFTLWQSEKSPMLSGAERAMLYRFVDSFHIQNLTGLTPDRVAMFIGGELSDFYSERARIAIGRFLRFARWAGYANVPGNETELQLFMTSSRMGRPRNEDMISETKEMIEQRTKEGRGASYREVAKQLALRHKRAVHPTSVFRWAKYPKTD